MLKKTSYNLDSRLDPEDKTLEIQKLLPLLGPFAQDFIGIQKNLRESLGRFVNCYHKRT